MGLLFQSLLRRNRENDDWVRWKNVPKIRNKRRSISAKHSIFFLRHSRDVGIVSHWRLVCASFAVGVDAWLSVQAALGEISS